MSSKKSRFHSKFGDVCTNSERYILLLSFEKVHGANHEALDSFRQKIFTNTSQVNSEQRKHHIAVVNPSSCLKYRDQSVDADWLTLDHQHMGSASKKNMRRLSGKGDASLGVEEVLENQEVQINELDIAFAELIHALADKLPHTGHYLDIIWLAKPNTDITITDHVSLYGALQRLCSWHDGILTVVLEDITPDRPHNNTLNAWVNHLHGRVVDSVDQVLQCDLAWRGDLVVADEKGQKSLCLPGFALSSLVNKNSKVHVETVQGDISCMSPKMKASRAHPSKKIVTFSRQLQVVCTVQRADVPSMYLSPVAMSLHLLPGSRLPRSEHYLRWLSAMSQSNDTAVIMRLPCRTLMPSSSSQHAEPLSTKEWKEHIRNNSGDLSVPDLHLQETQEYFYLLAYHGDPSQDFIIAHIMYSPHDLSGAVHAKLAEYQDSLSFDEHQSDRTSLNTIPSLDGGEFQSLLEEIELIQAEALKKLIEDRKSEGREPVITVAELRLLMETVYSTFMSKRDESSETADNDLCTDELINNNIISELDVSPSGWMERLALQNHEALEKKIKRFKSGEMMLAGMPVPAPADNTITLSAEEFLKHFLASGLSSTEDLSPVGAVGPSGLYPTRHSCSDLDWNKLKNATFQEAQKYYSSPGIQYCLDSRKSQQVDRHFSKMQQRYIRYETASTCSSEQAASPATLIIPPSATTNPASATKKGKGRLRLNSRGQRSAEKHQRLMLEKSRKISPGRIHGRVVKRQRPDVASVTIAKKRILPTRTSPRKSVTVKAKPENKPLSEKTMEDTNKRSSTSSEKSRKMSRSERTRMKLRQIVKETVTKRGITKDSGCYKACTERLYKMSELYVKDLKTSKGLDEEMMKIAEANADFVVQFEQNRIKSS